MNATGIIRFNKNSIWLYWNSSDSPRVHEKSFSHISRLYDFAQAESITIRSN